MQENIAVAIIKNSQNKVLIASRLGTEINPEDPNILWVFPGVKFDNMDEVATSLPLGIKQKTGFKISVGDQISDRKHPEIPGKHHYYFECALDSTVMKPIMRVNETQQVKFVDPSELGDYFTTSLDAGVAKYLGVSTDLNSQK